MFMHTPQFSIYFGDAADDIDECHYEQWGGQLLYTKPHYARVQAELAMREILFLDQVHGISGMAVTAADRECHSFITEGDFLITQEPQLGIGMMTADCMPIVCYDARTHSLGIAHAGWRGLLGGVVPAMIEAMMREYGVVISDLAWWVGPHARPCCYIVSADFGLDIPADVRSIVMIERNSVWFFDAFGFLRIQLERLDASVAALNHDCAACTICTPRFCSHRRSRGATLRNMTIATLLP